MKIAITPETPAEKMAMPEPMVYKNVAQFAIGIRFLGLSEGGQAFPEYILNGDFWTVLHGLEELKLYHVGTAQGTMMKNIVANALDAKAADDKMIRNGKSSIIATT